MGEGLATAFSVSRMAVPRTKTLAAAAVLLIGCAFALDALSPSLEALNRFALLPQDRSAPIRSYELSGTSEPGFRTLYIPSAARVAGLEIGSTDIVTEPFKGASGFGLASEALVIRLPPKSDPDTTALRIRLGEDHGRIGVSRAFLAPSAVAEQAAQAQRKWAWRNQVMSMTIAVLAALVLLVLLGGVSPNFSPGALAALAYLVLAQALARERDVGEFLGLLIDGAEYFLAIWVAFALSVALNNDDGIRRFARVRLVLLILSSVLVFAVGSIGTTFFLWAPAAVAAPFIAIGVIRTWHAAGDPGFSPVSFAAMMLALAAAAFGLMRAAEPSLFNEAFGLATLHALGALPLLAVGAAALGRYTFTARRESIAKLKADYAAQSAELGGVRATLQEEARKRMLFEERSRITRDMHDGIGGRLLSLLIRVRAGRLDIAAVEREVQESLNDLRLIVDSLDSAGDSMGAALNAFKARAERQLVGAGMVLDWPEDEGNLDGVTLEPQALLNVFRILQEAVSNAIGHSGAAKVSIAVARDGDMLSIVIADDGRGLASETGNGHGKGLKNMKARAERLGAALSMGSNGDKGHRISIVLPLKQPVQSSEGSSSQPS